jgi:hypothetical protein
MSLDELLALEEYQRSCACETETDIDLITDTIDRLTTNGKTRDGRTIIRKRRNEIIQAMTKLHDLFVEVIEPEGIVNAS